MPSLKFIAAATLNRHPLGSLLGVALLDRFDVLLPHDASYLGFARIAQAYDLLPKVILDIGAHSGYSARGFLKILPGWNVISFESNAIHRARLETIASRHPGRFTFQIGAVTDTSKGPVDFYTATYRGIPLSTTCASSPERALGGAETQFPWLKGKASLLQTSAPSVSIDELGIDATFVKLDIEGGELDALKGMRLFLERCKAVLLVELGYASAELVAYLADLEYHPWAFDPTDGAFTRGSATMDWWKNPHVNQFFVHSSLADKIPLFA